MLWTLKRISVICFSGQITKTTPWNLGRTSVSRQLCTRRGGRLKTGSACRTVPNTKSSATPWDHKLLPVAAIPWLYLLSKPLAEDMDPDRVPNYTTQTEQASHLYKQPSSFPRSWFLIELEIALSKMTQPERVSCNMAKWDITCHNIAQRGIIRYSNTNALCQPPMHLYKAILRT